jgi:ATP-dependent RNA helicase DDX31/DBP7
VFGRKQVKKAITEATSETFNFIENEKSAKEIPKKKKSYENVSIDNLLEKHVELPKQLPVIDFPDEPTKSNRNNKKRKNPENTVDFAKQPVAKFNKVPEMKMKKKKVKFSKVSNPFPNEPSKKPENAKNNQQQQKTLLNKEQQKASKLSSLDVERCQNSNVFSADSVDSLKIHSFSIKNLKEVLNFHKLTHIQQKSIPPALEGRDMLIRSVTGSGKTLTYALPIVEKLHNIKPNLTRSQGIHALIIVPTRELCIQTYEVFVKLVKPFTWLVPGYLSGGEKRKTEKARLRNGITILITTPGRLCDHLMHTESLKLDNVQTFVLDEADRLLELGYENDVKKVVDTISEQSKKESSAVQTMLLSATLTAKVKELAGLTLANPVFVDNEHSDKIMDSLHESDSDGNIIIPTEIDQKYFMVPPRMRFIILCSLLVQQMSRGTRKILIFFPTQHVVDFHYDILVEFLTQSFTRKPKTAQSYLNNDDIDGMLEEQEESDDDDDDAGNIWLPNVTFFKYAYEISIKTPLALTLYCNTDFSVQ